VTPFYPFYPFSFIETPKAQQAKHQTKAKTHYNNNEFLNTSYHQQQPKSSLQKKGDM
jgi:hypothetical protein